MSGPFHPTGRARVSPRSPSAHGICQRCGFRYLRNQLRNQVQWQGLQLQPLNIYVCHTCYDRPSPFLKTIILPPDPIAIPLSFPEPFNAEVPSYMRTTTGLMLTLDDGTPLTMQIQITPTPNPSQSYLAPPDFPLPQA